MALWRTSKRARETKGMANFNGSKWELKELFKNYMEDYNTATMPSLKYYSLEKWERQEALRKAAKEARKRRKGMVSSAEKSVFEDEKERAKEVEEEREQRKQKMINTALSSMDMHKVKAMREQKMLQAQMVLAHRQGNTKEAERIQKLLTPS